MKFWIAFLLFGILILIVGLSSRLRNSKSDSANNLAPIVAPQIPTNSETIQALQRSNHLGRIKESRVDDAPTLINVKSMVQSAHPAADQLADLLEQSGFSQQEASRLFVKLYNDLARIRQFEDMLSKDWIERTAEIVQLEERTDLSEARKRQEYNSLSASLSAISNELRKEQSEIRDRLLETVGTPPTMEITKFQTRLLSIYPRGPLPESTLKGFDDLARKSVRQD